jgi:UDP-N-acetylmuramoyl-tripeptide--D-alanyl-D-alanine ligase
MNHIGEVLPLAHMVSPTIALVNNAQREHLANLGSVKLTAIENGSVFRAVQYGGIAIYPSGDLFTPYWNRMARGLKKVRFSATGRAAVFGQRDKSGAFSIWQNSHLIRFRNPLLVGLHNVHNAVAAATVAMSTGIDHEQIRLGLESFIPPKGRLTHYSISHTDGCMILVDDTYNANPDSVEAALSLVATYAGKKLLIFGDMAECISPAETHRLVGEYAKRLGFHAVWSVGKFSRWSGLAFEKNSYHFENLSDAIASVSRLRGYDAILVKASRFMKLELLVEAIREDLAQSCSDRRAGA